MSTSKPTTVDEYISLAPTETQEKLKELRAILKEAAPQAKELLKWGKPAFEAEYILFVYSGFKNHVSLHPTEDAITALKDELQAYITSDNTLQFSLTEPLPLRLISKVANLRVEQSKQGVKWK